MACSGQCYVNVCSSYVPPNFAWDYTLNGENGAYACPGNSYAFPTAAGQPIYDENIESLRASINDERARRGYGAYPFTPDPIYGYDETGLPNGAPDASYISATDGGAYPGSAMLQLKNAINDMRANWATASISEGGYVTYDIINHLRVRIDQLRAECFCNGDCGGHLICSCYGQCNCDYCDERLKENIVYL